MRSATMRPCASTLQDSGTEIHFVWGDNNLYRFLVAKTLIYKILMKTQAREREREKERKREKRER